MFKENSERQAQDFATQGVGSNSILDMFMLPRGFGKWGTVYYYFRKWLISGYRLISGS
jgi:hypothetical protein